MREAERNAPQLTIVELTVELATERAASRGIDNAEIHKRTLPQSVQICELQDQNRDLFVSNPL